MKKLFALAFGMLLLGAGALAQTTSVTATVTDSDGTIWKNGTWSVDFVANPANPYGTYYFNGSIIPPSMIHQSGSIDSSGALSFIVDQNASITPVGSSWNLKVCPDAITQCGIFNFTAIGASMDLSAFLTTAIPAPRFHPVSGAYGYADIEASLQLLPGSTYWNVSSSVQRCYSGAAWSVCNSGNGTNTPSPQFQVPYYLGPGTSAIIKGDSGITTDGSGNLTATSLNAVISTDRYSSGSATGGIAEAIAACPLITSGCKVQLGGNISIASPQTITPVAGAVLTLDFNGFTVTCTNTTGVCLTINLASAGRHNFIMKDATIDGAGAGTGTTGLELENGVDGELRTIRVQNFYQTGSQGVVLNNIEDFHGLIRSEQNFSGVLYENASNNNNVDLYINDGGATASASVPGASTALSGIALSMQGSSGNDIGGLIQSNKGTQTVLMGAGSNYNKFDALWFENNGDQTSNTRLVTFQTSAGNYVLQTKFDTCNISGGALGGSGYIFSTASPAQVFGVLIENGYEIGYAGFADTTFGTYKPFVGISDDDTISGWSAYFGSYIEQGTSGGYFGPLGPTGAVTFPSDITVDGNLIQNGGGYFSVGTGGLIYPSGAGAAWSTDGWLAYATGGAFYLRDTTNGVSQFLCNKGTGTTGYCQASGELVADHLQTSYLNQTASNNMGGTCTMSASTSCTITLSHSYNTPVCIVTQQSATLTGGAAGCTVSGTTVTITSAVANSETWGAFVFGNPT